MSDVIPKHSCPTCKHYHKTAGQEPCLECISRWTDEQASKWEKNEKSCTTCKYGDNKIYQSPCTTCNIERCNWRKKDDLSF